MMRLMTPWPVMGKLRYLSIFGTPCLEVCSTTATKRLTPAVYEQLGIITSLNLYDFSEAKNQEMGVLFERNSDPDLFAQAADEALRIIRISGATIAELRTPTPRTAEEPSNAYNKLTTGKLAEKLGIELTKLFDKLIGHGYLELRDGGKRYLTSAGRNAGGEFRMGKGPYFLWPADLQL